MGETSGQIERHIQETRNDLGDNFNELEEKVKTAVDWRAQFEERPMTMIALAFGGGVLLSALLRSTRGRNAADWGPTRSSFESAPTTWKSNTALDETTNQASETWNTLKGALVGVGVAKLSGFVEDVIPGFKDELAKAQTSKRRDASDILAASQAPPQKASAAGAD